MDQIACFDLFFRKCPFKGEFTIFGGLDDCLRFLNTFGYSKEDISALEERFPNWDKEFWSYLGSLNASNLSVYAQREGSVCFPRIPLLRIEGPVAVCQLIETTLLNLVNYASLVTTNASRIRRAVGPKKALLEFGLRRAQGPDGAMSASKYAYIGGFDGTSNVLAGLKYGVPIKGTHAHSFVTSFPDLDVLDDESMMISPAPLSNLPSFPLRCDFAIFAQNLKIEVIECVAMNDWRDIRGHESNEPFNIKEQSLEWRLKLDNGSSTNEGELAAFIAYAAAYPSGFLALVDTYDTLNSGIINFMAVSLALHEYGYKSVGIRLDSGDLAYLSKEVRAYFKRMAAKFKVAAFERLTIVASNDINEAVVHALREQGHEIDAFGIGTHLVTCKRQPALGCVYKLVAIGGKPRIKVSQSQSKMTIPGKKMAYRLWTKSTNTPILDLLVRDPEETSSSYVQTGKKILCEHAFDATKRCSVTPSKVEQLLIEVFKNGKVTHESPSLQDRRDYSMTQVSQLREDHLRYTNPTPYKVSVSESLRALTQNLWRREVPVVDYQ